MEVSYNFTILIYRRVYRMLFLSWYLDFIDTIFEHKYPPKRQILKMRESKGFWANAKEISNVHKSFLYICQLDKSILCHINKQYKEDTNKFAGSPPSRPLSHIFTYLSISLSHIHSNFESNKLSNCLYSCIC